MSFGLNIRGACLALAACAVWQAHGCREGRALAELSDSGAPDADADADTDADASTYGDTDVDSDTDSGTTEYACDGEPWLDVLYTVDIDASYSMNAGTHVAQVFVPNDDLIEVIELRVQEPTEDLGPHLLFLANHETELTEWSQEIDIPYSPGEPIPLCLETGGVSVETGSEYSLHIQAADGTNAETPLVLSAVEFGAYEDGAMWVYSDNDPWNDEWIETGYDVVFALY